MPKEHEASLGPEKTHESVPVRDDTKSVGDQVTIVGELTGETVVDGLEILDIETRYTIEGVLGKGGMGEVLLAKDSRLDRHVAIKRI